MDAIEEQINFPGILVVGLGGAGTNVVTRLSQSKLKGVECVAIASKSPYELQNIPLAHKVSLWKALAPQRGFDGYPWEGLTVPRIKDMVRREIPELLSKQGLVIVTSGLGGHGGFAASIVARLAREAGNLVVGVVTRPYKFEGQSRQRYADQALELLLAEANSVITISDNNIASTLEEHLLSVSKVIVSDFFKLADESVCEVIKTIIYPMVKPAPPQDFIFSWDSSDYPKDTWSGVGHCSVAIGYAQGENSQTPALKAALASPLLEKYLGKASMAYATLKTGTDCRLIDTYESLDMLMKTVDRGMKHAPAYQWIVGVLTDPNLDRTNKAVVIMSGPIGNRTCAKTFQNTSTCDACRYSVHTGFVEIPQKGFEVVYYCPTCDKTITLIAREELYTQKPPECIHCKNTDTLLCQQGNTGISCSRCRKGTFVGEEVLIKC